MGQLIYGAWRWRIDFDDRTLHHLRIALERRMLIGAPFRLTWAQRGRAEHHPNAITIHPSSPLEYHFDQRETSGMNRLWLRSLLHPIANQDMVVTREPDPRLPARRNATETAAAAIATTGTRTP
ncbi:MULTISPECIES: hypothetical protein [unclassified Rathayibacter]|uniref:DUF7882 family protein n=1 Tax=unclassified Rathayibacter TaxID=2609250 RepID=UPI0010529F23|nr:MULTISPECIES: hypothetical protein [unclassified Rathayibacter]TCL79394.1 hypothetical protein EDF49_11130 [Rathayibacter sp. PhB192]TCM25338.1 hypothetical protein EDF43_111166 [Rathayibacter sp. PhB179]